MIGAANPIDAPQAWDVFTIQGLDTPGRCEVKGFKRVTKWDVKVGRGTAGATETVEGRPPAQGSVTFYAWTREHFAAWDVILPRLEYDPTKQTKLANAVFYPSLADIGVDSVNIESIGAWEHQGGGMYVRTLELLEFAPPPKKSAAATPKGAGSGAAASGAGGAPGSQPDPAIVELQRQRDEAMREAQQAYGS